LINAKSILIARINIFRPAASARQRFKKIIKSERYISPVIKQPAHRRKAQKSFTVGLRRCRKEFPWA
jgi:hypothetical protein